MITRNLTINQFEVGDVLDLSGTFPRSKFKQCTVSGATRGLVCHVHTHKTGESTYTIMMDNGRVIKLTPVDQGGEKYAGHIDMGPLYEGAESE